MHITKKASASNSARVPCCLMALPLGLRCLQILPLVRAVKASRLLQEGRAGAPATGHALFALASLLGTFMAALCTRARQRVVPVPQLVLHVPPPHSLPAAGQAAPGL